MLPSGKGIGIALPFEAQYFFICQRKERNGSMDSYVCCLVGHWCIERLRRTTEETKKAIGRPKIPLSWGLVVAKRGKVLDLSGHGQYAKCITEGCCHGLAANSGRRRSCLSGARNRIELGACLSSVLQLFLRQMVTENGLPFRPSCDPFYSQSNIEALKRSLAQLEAGMPFPFPSKRWIADSVFETRPAFFQKHLSAEAIHGSEKGVTHPCLSRT